MASTPVRTNLTGLARRLVMDGLLAEEVASTAWQDSLKAKQSFVGHLVEKKLADPAAIAFAAAHEFGVPLLDLAVIDIDSDTFKVVDQKLIEKHRALPLFRRGKKLFLGVSDPTNLAALDEIKFQTNHVVEPIVVEEHKLSKAIEKALAAADTSMKDLDDGMDDFAGLETVDPDARRIKPNTGLVILGL